MSGKLKSAMYMATGYFKSLVGWSKRLGDAYRSTDRAMVDVLDILQSPIDDGERGRALRALGRLSRALDQQVKDVEGAFEVARQAANEVNDRTASENNMETTRIAGIAERVAAHSMRASAGPYIDAPTPEGFCPREDG